MSRLGCCRGDVAGSDFLTHWYLTDGRERTKQPGKFHALQIDVLGPL